MAAEKAKQRGSISTLDFSTCATIAVIGGVALFADWGRMAVWIHWAGIAAIIALLALGLWLEGSGSTRWPNVNLGQDADEDGR